MDYEKKYKNLVKWINLLSHTALTEDQHDIVDKILEKSNESEDEKIKEDIISLVNEFWEKIGSINPEYSSRSKMLAWLEKQGEQKSADKVEPKFNVNNWIVTKANNLYQITAIVDDKYQLKYGDNYSIQKCADVDKNARLWTIEDAKDGDVLVDSYSKDSIIILYKGIYKERNILSYCGWNGYYLSIKTNGLGYGGLDNTNYLPATKEQRNLLFAKMKEAGYEFDFEKKELKKIDPPVLSSSSNIGKNVPADWSEEDEKNINGILTVLESWDRYHVSAAGLPSIIPEFINWLKSLKEKYTWKPSDEQMKQLYKVFNGACWNDSVIESLYNDLNKLKC